MVNANQVPFEEKHGNDQADIAAEKGTELPHGLRLFAGFYEKRHQQYTKLIGRIQNFIVKVRKEEQRIRREKAKEANPFDDPNKATFLIPNAVANGHDMTNTMQVKVRFPRRREHGDEKGWEYAVKVANFIRKTRWCKEGESNENPGITWLELFVLFKMHDQKIPENVTKKDCINNQLAFSKKICRMVAADCISEDYEWIFGTCYNRQNRLKCAGVANKHAGIKGMPHITQREGEEMMKVILAIKGKASGKQKEERKGGRLKIKGAPLTYSRVMDPIEAVVGQFELRTNADAAEVMQSGNHQKFLHKIFSPKCQMLKDAAELKLKVKTTFSNVKRGCCGQVTNAKNWSCQCGVLWRKCDTHDLSPKVVRCPSYKRKKVSDHRGVDQPMPKIPKGGFVAAYGSKFPRASS